KGSPRSSGSGRSRHRFGRSSPQRKQLKTRTRWTELLRGPRTPPRRTTAPPDEPTTAASLRHDSDRLSKPYARPAYATHHSRPPRHSATVPPLLGALTIAFRCDIRTRPPTGSNERHQRPALFGCLSQHSGRRRSSISTGIIWVVEQKHDGLLVFTDDGDV